MKTAAAIITGVIVGIVAGPLLVVQADMGFGAALLAPLLGATVTVVLLLVRRQRDWTVLSLAGVWTYMLAFLPAAFLVLAAVFPPSD